MHGVFSVYVPTIGKSSSPSTCVVIVASVTMPSILAAIGIWFHRVTVPCYPGAIRLYCCNPRRLRRLRSRGLFVSY